MSRSWFGSLIKHSTWLFLLLLMAQIFNISHAEEKYEFTSEQQRLDFIKLNEELRCPKCQNQNIADSNALIATDMKRKVYELLQEGKSTEQVVEFMKVRYGDFVHYEPPMTPLTLWLYLGPAMFIVLAMTYFILSNRSRQKQTSDTSLNTENPMKAPQNVSSGSETDRDNRLEQAEKALKELE